MSNLKDVLTKSAVFRSLEGADLEDLLPQLEMRILHEGDILSGAG